MAAPKKFKLTIVTRDRRYPDDELGGKVLVDRQPGYFTKWDDAPATYEVDQGEHTIYFGTPTKSDRCMYEPESGVEVIMVGNDMTYTGYYKCTEARRAVERLRGQYSAKREDHPHPYTVDFHFEVNHTCCLIGSISAVGTADRADGFAHMVTESGQHGAQPHRGDYMDANRPLTAGFFQGDYRGNIPGERGTFRFKLGLVPMDDGQVVPTWFGFISHYESGQPVNIQVVFTRTQPVWWTSSPPA